MSALSYYVYILYREDGVTPFYVGMGKGDRIHMHEAEARYPSPRGNKHKLNIIRQMQAKGIEVSKHKIAAGLGIEEALDLEIKTILEIGRVVNGGPLVNATDGGDRGQQRLSEEAKAFLGQARKKRTVRVAAPHRVCPECGEPFKAHHGKQQFCCPAHQAKFHDRNAVRGKSLLPLLQVWRAGKHGNKALSPYAFAQLCVILDAYNAEDRAAGRVPERLVAGKAEAGWAGADLIHANSLNKRAKARVQAVAA